MAQCFNVLAAVIIGVFVLVLIGAGFALRDMVWHTNFDVDSNGEKIKSDVHRFPEEG